MPYHNHAALAEMSRARARSNNPTSKSMTFIVKDGTTEISRHENLKRALTACYAVKKPGQTLNVWRLNPTTKDLDLMRVVK